MATEVKRRWTLNDDASLCRITDIPDFQFMQKLIILKAYSICYVQLTRALKEKLKEKTEVLDSPNGVKLVLQVADRAGLLRSPIDQWFEYVDMHERTSDDRIYESADKAIDMLPDFIDDASDLYQSMMRQSEDEYA